MATAARLEIGVTEAPGVDRPSLLQLPQLIDKAIHLRQELAMPAVAHAIEELDELLARRLERGARAPLPEPATPCATTALLYAPQLTRRHTVLAGEWVDGWPFQW